MIPSALPSSLDLARCAADAYREDTRPDVVIGSTELYLSSLSGVTVITWRGSAGGVDWLMDGLAYPWYAPELGCWVHRGFIECARASALRVVEMIHDIGSPAVFVGHSKGGAEATLTAALLASTPHYRPRALVTFGSPRCGFKGLGKLITGSGIEVRRFVHGRDLVPRVPFLLGWQHVGAAIQIGMPGGPVSDHFMAGYLRALTGAAVV